MRKSALGPFPKVKRLAEICRGSHHVLPGEELAAANRLADAVVARLQTDAEDSRDMVHLIDAVVSSRTGSVELDPGGSPALGETVRQVVGDPGQPSLFAGSAADAWREFDGAAFCDLARTYYRHYLTGVLAAEFGERGEDLEVDFGQFALEASQIVRAFSARWAHNHLVGRSPDAGSVAWFHRHCLGKLELEIEREHSEWVESRDNPRRSKSAGIDGPYMAI